MLSLNNTENKSLEKLVFDVFALKIKKKERIFRKLASSPLSDKLPIRMNIHRSTNSPIAYFFHSLFSYFHTSSLFGKEGKSRQNFISQINHHHVGTNNSR